jgi:ubiquinone/menaquinone biosynthesis C-methylase UbiE
MWESHHYRFGLAGEGQADMIQEVLDRQPGVVLNVGCAFDGMKSARLALHCRTQVAIDHDLRMVTCAQGECSVNNVRFLAADAHSLPLVGQCADHVVALGLFSYANDPAAVFVEFSRVIRRSGCIMITNAVSRQIGRLRRAGVDAGLKLIDETEGYCPASGDLRRRDMLVFSKN